MRLISCLLEIVPGSCPMVIFFQVDGDHPVNLPMPGRKRKGKQDVLPRQRRRQRPRLALLFPTKTMFFVRFARSVSRTESSCV